MAGHYRDDDEESRPASWTRGEKQRVIAVVVAYEKRHVFWATCKSIIFTAAAIVVALTTLKIAFGDYFAAFIVALQQGHH